MYLFMGLAMLIPLETVSNNFDYIGMNASVAKKIDEILKDVYKRQVLYTPWKETPVMP